MRSFLRRISGDLADICIAVFAPPELPEERKARRARRALRSKSTNH